MYLTQHTDHLGTVRALSQLNTANTLVWRWDVDQFGDVLPTGNLIMPLRHPGQYYDAEVGIFYNYFRDYDPATGRYLQSDPIGLNSSWNTYTYVDDNPLLDSDLDGLAGGRGERGISGGLGGKNSSNPYKHCREFNPPDPRFVQCKNPQTGKRERKPRPAEMPFPEPDKCGEQCQKRAYTVLGGTGGAYIIYRCARMIPSLYPPLWWSIPSNAVTP